MPFWTIHRRPKYAVKRDRTGKLISRDFAGTAVMASAALISKEQVRSVVGRKQDWQRDGWDLYDSVPELRFGVSWIANACSRARLYVGIIDPDGSSEPTPVSADPDEDGVIDQAAVKALAPLEELGGGQLGQSEMLRRIAIHLNVPGESYVVGFDDPETDDRCWLVCSPDEIQSSGSTVKITSPDMPNEQIEIDPAQATILRIWRPHPRLAHLADSPLLALRQPLRELVDLSAHITASAESRLAGAGVLFVPDELTTPSPEQSEGANPLHPDPFTAALIEAMAAPLKNRDSASAVVPLVVRGPADKGKELKHLAFSTDLDANVQTLRESAIRRVATGMDMPPEVLTGLGDSNHWSAWQVEESAIKLHIEPLLALICDSLTTNFLQPILEALEFENPKKYAIWFDSSELTMRPNRAPESMQAHEAGLISDDTARRDLGYSDEDAPSKEEQQRALIVKIVTAAPTLAPSLLPYLGIVIPETEAAAAQADAIAAAPPSALTPASNVRALPAPTSTAPAARPGGRPGSTGERNVPTRDGLERAMTASSAREYTWRERCLDMAVRRALSRAGQYLLRATPRSQRAQLQQMSPEVIHLTLHASPDQLDQMLANAYTEFHAATPGEECLHLAVDHYVRALLLAREEHRADYLDRAITQFGCDGGMPRAS
ncbi:hypothetical protein [Streptomyces sp. NPDC059278]|uniref:hypothetical protein n=1 Tax=Streptomyces sp. NPDC059278 TaxID=3346801 RepID=UPI0036771C5E